MSDWQPLKFKQWYRIDGQVVFCIWSVEAYQKDGSVSIDMGGIQPQDYAAYITHMFIGENKEPYRSVGEIAGIPMPEAIRLRFSSNARIEEISTEEALCKEENASE